MLKLFLFVLSIFVIVIVGILYPEFTVIVVLSVLTIFALKNNKGSSEKNIQNLEESHEEDKNISTNTISKEKINIKQVEKLEKTNNIKIAKPKPNYVLPPLSLLDNIDEDKIIYNEIVRKTKNDIERTLRAFRINAQVIEIHIGPIYTQYEIKIPTNIRISAVTSLKNNIALSLEKNVNIEALIYGKSSIGINVFDKTNVIIKFKDIISHSNSNKGLQLCLGKNMLGEPITFDLTEMPHLLIAGSTGSGKSVCINSFICSILMRYKPDEVKLMLIDPRKLELFRYENLPHLLSPVISDTKKASVALQKLVTEIECRYNLFSEKNVKNILDYNNLVDKENKNNSAKIPHMPYIVAIIDELADLMFVAKEEIEDSIMRITQMARSAGIHLIITTQRPSNDIITGFIKNNIPSRIAFKLPSGFDNRTILGNAKADNLKENGEMIFLQAGNKPIHIKGCFVSDEEIKKIVDHILKQQVNHYDYSIENLEINQSNNVSHEPLDEKDNYDEQLYNEIVEFAIETGKISTSLIQRRFRLGYNKAARIIDLLEERGIIGPANGSKPREVLLNLKSK